MAFVAPIQNIPRDGKLRLTNIGYPVFRFVKDVVVNNKEVLDEQARMAELSNMKDTERAGREAEISHLCSGDW